VKGVLEKHGGTVDVMSELKKGSTFTIHIPYNHEKEN
jgi:signal transduction histidine kinase